jgi:hypothetical protein
MGSDFFNNTTTAELWARLTAEQVFQTENDPFFKDLPSQATKAVACLVFEALRECGQGRLVDRVKFENGEFYIPNNPNPCGLMEPLKECSQYQTLPQHLADLADWMVN